MNNTVRVFSAYNVMLALSSSKTCMLANNWTLLSVKWFVFTTHRLYWALEARQGHNAPKRAFCMRMQGHGWGRLTQSKACSLWETADITLISLISTAFALTHLVIAVIMQTSDFCVHVFFLTWDFLFEWRKWFSNFSMCFFLKATQDLCRAAAVNWQSLQ